MNEDRSAEDLYRDPQGEVEDEGPRLRAIAPPPKTNSPEDRKRKQTDDKARELRIESDWQAVLSTDEGRRLTAHILLNICGYQVPMFHPSNSHMCNIAGRRQVAGDLEEAIQAIGLDFWVPVLAEIRRLRAEQSKAPSGRAAKP